MVEKMTEEEFEEWLDDVDAQDIEIIGSGDSINRILSIIGLDAVVDGDGLYRLKNDGPLVRIEDEFSQNGDSGE